MADDLIEIGFIRGAHGLRGQVIVHAYSREEDSLVGYGPLQNQDGSKQYKLTITGDKGQDFLCKIDGIADRNGAESLRGVKLYIAAKKLPQPEENEFYIKDLVGLSVVNSEEIMLGKIVNVMTLGAHDALEITFTHDGTQALPAPQTELLLFTHANVPNVDLTAGRVTVNLPYGLLGEAVTERTKDK